MHQFGKSGKTDKDDSGNVGHDSAVWASVATAIEHLTHGSSSFRLSFFLMYKDTATSTVQTHAH